MPMRRKNRSQTIVITTIDVSCAILATYRETEVVKFSISVNLSLSLSLSLWYTSILYEIKRKTPLHDDIIL